MSVSTTLSNNDPMNQTVAGWSSRWSLRDRELSFGDSPVWMGILNVTPDSFSDGGKFYTVQSAVDQAKRMEDAGAGILDIGGESTRPYSEAVAIDEELQRVAPVFEALQGKIGIPISIDTTKSKVAAAAFDLGACILNDVSGLEFDPEMIAIAKKYRVGICAMHMQGTPQTMQDNPHYDNVVEDILRYLKSRRDWLLEQGIEREKICLDPGIGFGKSHEHNLTLIQKAERFHETGCPILVGHSRKGFIAKVLGDKSMSRTAGTVGASLALSLSRIQILRVHDVAEHRQAMQLFAACRPN